MLDMCYSCVRDVLLGELYMDYSVSKTCVILGVRLVIFGVLNMWCGVCCTCDICIICMCIRDQSLISCIKFFLRHAIRFS